MKAITLNLKLAVGAAAVAFLAAVSPATAGTVMASEKEYKEPFPEEEAESWWSAELSAGWDSQYIFRGVDILDDGPIAWTQLTVSAGGFTAGAWYANGTDGGDPFSELDLFLGYTYEVGPVAFEVGGIWYFFPEEGSSTDDTYELYAGVTYSIVEWLSASLYYYYDFELFQASYLEAKLEASFPVTESVSVDPWIAVAFGDYNHGSSWVYDHAETGVAVNVALNDTVTVSGYGAYARAGDGTRDATFTSDDEWWGGASVAFSF